MSYGILIVGLEGFEGEGPPTALDGLWLSRYEPEKWRYQVIDPGELDARLAEWVEATDDPARALTFEKPSDALEVWRQALPSVRPWDGKPNRPLTSFSVSVERLPGV